MIYRLLGEAQVFYQPVRLSVAAELAERRVGPLARLTDQAYQQGRLKLQTALQEQGAEAIVGSEITLIEMWAQKGKAISHKLRFLWPCQDRASQVNWRA